MCPAGDDRGSESEESIAQILIDSAQSPRHQNVYFVGPFANRVSFASQQRRALHLIWAIEFLSTSGFHGKRAAVVGAGIAGLTCCVALKALGCLVDLIDTHPVDTKNESDQAFLRHFTQASHRYIHPTINAWPDGELHGTTDLPFLNWHEGKCPDVSFQLDSSWRDIEKSKKLVTETYFGHEVKQIEVKRSGADEKYVIVALEKKRIKTGIRKREIKIRQGYDLVFMATGFGRETILDCSDARGYWESDLIDDYRCDELVQRLTVSGTGDGGVTDALRFVLKGYRAGRLPKFLVDVAKDEVLKRKIEEKEKGALERLRRNMDANEDDYIAVYDELTAELCEFYSDIALNLPKQLRDEIVEDCNQGNVVTLIGEREEPFSPGVSPLSKILLALLQKARRIKYYQNRRRGKILVERDGDVRKVIFTGPSGKNHEIPSDRFISRHGPNPPLREIFGDDVTKRLETRQRLFGHFGWSLDKDIETFAERLGLPTKTRRPAEFAEAHAGLARSYIQGCLGLSSIEVGLSDSETVFRISCAPSVEIPKNIFGIRAVHGGKGEPKRRLVEGGHG